ncbi:hypothetical protein IHQ71_25110 [Rhizobium sp. TH2]|uniref:hypothetical protein n=1 Tax=Rhizobium sp. TH2 TaxID=2775403 RepID=UPI0021580FCA|nr:hypothetical protein [Rhizobium sp. TH2]UVC08389.1 hypothetical protein IHQ71_25110 [Rhizobium sp. TH2]
MRKVIALACAATFGTATFALADSVTIRTDNEPTGSIVVKERHDPDIIIKKKRNKVIVRERDDPDLVIKGRVNID